jgi:hypothetical protein
MTEITYTQVRDYLLPDLTLLLQTDYHIGKYGRLRKTYLKLHKNGIYSGLFITGKLNSHLSKIDLQAHGMLEFLMKQMAERRGINEQLKETYQMAWVGAMTNIKACAEEVVLNEIIYV